MHPFEEIKEYSLNNKTGIKQVTTDGRRVYKFYPVTGVVKFGVKASCDAHILLSSGSAVYNDAIEIVIGSCNNSESAIKTYGDQFILSNNETKNILSCCEFREFFVEWKSGEIKVHRKGEDEAFLSWTNTNTFSVKYYGLRTEGSLGSWNIVVPENYGTWQDFEKGDFHEDAVVGGQLSDGQQIFVARARHGREQIPGKLITSHRCATIPCDGAEQCKDEYQVLLRGPINWISTSGSDIPSDAFHAGETEDKEPLYVGRVFHEGNCIPGKVQKSHGVCYICHEGKEIGLQNYEVLVD